MAVNTSHTQSTLSKYFPTEINQDDGKMTPDSKPKARKKNVQKEAITIFPIRNKENIKVYIMDHVLTNIYCPEIRKCVN